MLHVGLHYDSMVHLVPKVSFTKDNQLFQIKPFEFDLMCTTFSKVRELSLNKKFTTSMLLNTNGFKVVYSRGNVILWKAPDLKFEIPDSAFRQLGLMKKCVLSSVNFLNTKIEYFVGAFSFLVYQGVVDTIEKIQNGETSITNEMLIEVLLEIEDRTEAQIVSEIVRTIPDKVVKEIRKCFIAEGLHGVLGGVNFK